MLQTNSNRLAMGDWVRIAIISGLFIIIYSQVYDKKVAILGDNAAYYVLGKSIAEGYGFSSYASPTRNPHNHFTPGYPFFIAIVMTLFSDNIQLIKIFNGILTWGTGILLYLLALRLNMNKTVSLFIAATVLINAEVLYYSSVMMSEAIFMFTSILIFLFVAKSDDSKPFLQNPYFYLSLLFIIYSFYTRAFGVAISGAVIIYYLYQKKFYYALGHGVGFFLGILPWQIRSYSLGGSNQFNVLFRKNYYRPEEGIIDAGDLLTRVYNNIIKIIPAELPNTIFPFVNFNPNESNGFLQWIVGLSIIATMIYAARKLKTFGLLLGLYAFFTFIILLIWPDYFSFIRYIVPIVPVLTLLFFFGVFKLLTKVAKKLSTQVTSIRFNPYFLFIILLFYIPSVEALSRAAERNYPQQWADYFAMAEWTQRNIDQDAVICARKPNLFYLYSKHLSTNYKYTENPEELLKSLENKGVDYVVYDQLGFSTTPRCLGKAIQEKRERFELVHVLGSREYPTYLFKFKRGETN